MESIKYHTHPGRDEWKTALSTAIGHDEYIMIMYGLANAQAVFQSFVLYDMYVVIYIDEILGYSQSLEAHR